MSEHNLPPHAERMIAALYGELNAEDQAAWERDLERDPELRAEWDELCATRRTLGGWEVESAPANLVFLEPARRDPAGEGSRRRTWFRPAWGLAAAAAAAVVLLAAGARVDRVDNGVALTFGESRPAPVARYSDPGGDLPVTRADLSAYSTDMLNAVSAMLLDQRAQQEGELAYVLQNLYENLKAEQRREVDDLRVQIQGMGMGLWAEQTRTTARLESIMGLALSSDQAPAGSPPLNRKETKP